MRCMMKMFKASAEKMKVFFKKFSEYKKCCELLNKQNREYNKKFTKKD